MLRLAIVGGLALGLLAAAEAQPAAPSAEPKPHRLEAPLQSVLHRESPKPAPKKVKLSSRSGRMPLQPQDKLSGRTFTVTSTAYCLRGYTASGRPVGPGTIAVDPRVIPLGTRVFVSGYGYATALDTGGAIGGHKIDCWFPTLAECYRWGHRTVTITILDEPKRR